MSGELVRERQAKNTQAIYVSYAICASSYHYISGELMRERQATQDKILDAVNRKEHLLKADRQKLQVAVFVLLY
jgi:hypothetical protein